MTKKVLAIMFCLASLVTSVQSEEQNGWYLGTKLGWSHFNFLKDNVKHPKSTHENENHKKSLLNAPILGVFLGYDFNPYLGVEVENTTNGFFPHLMFQTNKEHIQFNSMQISTKLSYPITDDFHVYSRFGGKVFWDNLLSKKDLKNMFTKQSSFFPSVSLGAEYIFDEKFITRLDYTWKTNIENIIDHSVKPSLGDAVFSFGWKLGKPDINDIFSLEGSDVLNDQYTALDENINFPFNSVELKSVAYDKLEKLDHNIKNMKLKNISIVLSGHSDRIGNHVYNKKLSEDRAYNIKNYFTSKGFPKGQITVQAMGELYPLTDQVCNNIEDKSLLISCLSPDRRVEIKVLSTE